MTIAGVLLAVRMDGLGGRTTTMALIEVYRIQDTCVCQCHTQNNCNCNDTVYPFHKFSILSKMYRNSKKT